MARMLATNPSPTARRPTPLFGSRIHEALRKRYGIGFSSPHNHGRMLRAARDVLGRSEDIPNDDTLVSSPFLEEGEFLAAVHNQLPSVCGATASRQ